MISIPGELGRAVLEMVAAAGAAERDRVAVLVEAHRPVRGKSRCACGWYGRGVHGAWADHLIVIIQGEQP